MNRQKTFATPKPDFDKLLTIYGRNAVLEALQDENLQFHAIHLADSNRRAAVLDEISRLAEARGVALSYMGRRELSRISKNGKQDQGVAADLILPGMQTLADLRQCLSSRDRPQFIALDGVTNPQNLGMIIRAVAASGIDGLILPDKGCADIGPLAIKASAGTVFRCPIFRCKSIDECLQAVDGRATICAMELEGSCDWNQLSADRPRIFLLGNESDGVSKQLLSRADERLCIPMANGVESLNVAITAALVAFKVGN